MSHKKVLIGTKIDLTPMIVRATAMIAVPDHSKRKSEFRVIQELNLSQVADPNSEPRVFLECEVAISPWTIDTIVFDAETHERYKSVQGNATKESRLYLKRLKDYGSPTWPEWINKITNLKEVKEKVLGNGFSSNKT